MLGFEWDEGKNRTNQRKHGILFQEAQTVFFDEEAVEFDDPHHSADESRFLIVGRSIRHRILVISYCSRESIIRIISARKATKGERNYYLRRVRSL